MRDIRPPQSSGSGLMVENPGNATEVVPTGYPAAADDTSPDQSLRGTNVSADETVTAPELVASTKVTAPGQTVNSTGKTLLVEGGPANPSSSVTTRGGLLKLQGGPGAHTGAKGGVQVNDAVEVTGVATFQATVLAPSGVQAASLALTGGGTLTGLPASPGSGDEATSKSWVESLLGSFVTITRAVNFTTAISAIVYLIDATSGNVTGTLEDAALYPNQLRIFVRIDGSGNAVNVNTTSGQSINGTPSPSISLTSQWDVLAVVSNQSSGWVKLFGV